MSVYVVSDKHISYLVNAAIQFSCRDHGMHGKVQFQERQASSANAQAIGQMLLNENTASVNHRYAETDAPGTFQHTPTPNIDALHVLSLINGYRYQACEHPRWAGSPAWCFCQQLERVAIRCLPGYEEAPWSI